MARYVYKKIKLLRQFRVFLNEDQKRHLYSLKSEIAVDNAVRSFF